MDVNTIRLARKAGAIQIRAKICDEYGKHRIGLPLLDSANDHTVASLFTFDRPDESAEVWFLDAEGEFVEVDGEVTFF